MTSGCKRMFLIGRPSALNLKSRIRAAGCCDLAGESDRTHFFSFQAGERDSTLGGGKWRMRAFILGLPYDFTKISTTLSPNHRPRSSRSLGEWEGHRGNLKGFYGSIATLLKEGIKRRSQISKLDCRRRFNGSGKESGA
ncbi:hypothetical protein H6P81_015218 [Aristolochia fimbriata]|uniref:Uncharacterized protein n=1 Tax=Aristolochia fimbriata TaxID=158543 RepID=A0AAV7E5I8_ARIFI|nr:hypothetical protein H6P81_015218 [Aristolochia fimbriata]